MALPHLVIIVDEFAELKAEQPEFMKELISAARIGRSLGVHPILATQNRQDRLMTRFGVIQSSNCVLKYRRRRIVMKS